MPLIIETYELPYTKISNLLFNGKRFEHITKPTIETEEPEMFCYTRKDQDDYRAISYYFKKIYYIENGKIICVDKVAHKNRLYDFNTGKPILFNQAPAKAEEIVKSEFLPQLNAQNGDIVIFPDEEEDD